MRSEENIAILTAARELVLAWSALLDNLVYIQGVEETNVLYIKGLVGYYSAKKVYSTLLKN